MKKVYLHMLECNCPAANTMAVIGGKWKIMILNHLLERDHRFNELQRILKGITAHTLSKSLKELEIDEMIVRVDLKENPPKTIYKISRKGMELESVLKGIQQFGKKHPISQAIHGE